MANAPLPLWVSVDSYFERALGRPDPVLAGCLAAAAEAGMPDIHVAPNQGRLLHLLAWGAGSMLEIGTLAGYSTICLARALAPGGRVVTIEVNPGHAAVAAANFREAGVSDRVDLRVGPALDVLPTIAREGRSAGVPFDLVFIDADKTNIPRYFDWAVRLSRPGTLIVVDNVVRDGHVVDNASTDANVLGVRHLVEQLSSDRRVRASALQTVGVKGHDGFVLARVLAD